MFYQKNKKEKFLEKERKSCLFFLNQLSDKYEKNLIYIPYKYLNTDYNLIEYKISVSGNIILYSEIGQIIYAGNRLFYLYDFLDSIVCDKNLIKDAIVKTCWFLNSKEAMEAGYDN